VAKGAYVLASAESPKVILIATGSELSLAVGAYEALTAEGIPARVVSMPCWELFELQDEAYRDSLLPPDVKGRVSIEMGSVIGWDRYVGSGGAIVGMHTFGASAPAAALMTKFGFAPDKVLELARTQAAR
jgi:transketolase